MSHLVRSLLLLVLPGVSIVPWAAADAITSLSFTFQPNQLAMQNMVTEATDFHLGSGDAILKLPAAPPFLNVTGWKPNGTTANFAGGKAVGKGKTTVVTITTKKRSQKSAAISLPT